MKISELFDLRQGNSYELINMEADKSSNINFVSRTSENNGVVAKIKSTDKKPFPAGMITVALGGSVLSSFVQTKPFYTGYHVMVLIPKQEMTLEQKLFYCMCIKANLYRYQYGRQANKTLKDIDLPAIPSWLEKYKINYSPIETKIEKEVFSLNITNWKEFSLINIFESVTRGKRLKSEDRKSGNVRYFSASETNNGMTDKISNPLFIEKNALIYTTFGDCFYVDGEFTASDEVNIFKHSKLNKYNGLFLSTVINQNKYRYKFGRKAFYNKFKDEIIKLPALSDEKPDWDLMEKYIKSLAYSDKI